MINKYKLSMDAYNELYRKWSFPIIKTLFLGYKKFNDFLEINPGLTNGVLSNQLKKLEHFGYIKKEIVSTSPVKIEYSLTEVGLSLNKLCYEKVKFAIKYGIITGKEPIFSGKTIEEIFDI